MRRAARGDREAFAAIFDRHQQDLYRYCVAILGDPDDAQDALQNTMVRALRALPGERREIALKPWLYRIAHNEAIELRRRDVRAHLRDCADCRVFAEEIRSRGETLAAIAPLPAVVAAALAKSALAGSAGGVAAGSGATVGGGAGLAA